MELLAATGARVEYDARIRDRTTGKMRQVDIAVWQSSHHGEMLYAIDCKDYSRPVNVEIVEQIAQKALDIKADRAAIVSRRGFTTSAREKGRHLNVDLLTVTELEETEWPAWMALRTMQFVDTRRTVERIVFHEKEQLNIEPLSLEFSATSAIVRSPAGLEVSANDLLTGWLHAGGEELLPVVDSHPSESRFQTRIELPEGHTLASSLDPSQRAISALTVWFLIRTVARDIPVHLMSYQDSLREFEVSSAFVSDPVELNGVQHRLALSLVDEGEAGSRVQMVIQTID
ncbi:MAG: restriction endonuclease [Dehalococcoidia bacterium]|nr:restriction endonuclease [Dehalococcoidia bacterium]